LLGRRRLVSVGLLFDLNQPALDLVEPLIRAPLPRLCYLLTLIGLRQLQKVCGAQAYRVTNQQVKVVEALVD
jgi:hypothetical protein